jgi:hypothetical protein
MTASRPSRDEGGQVSDEQDGGKMSEEMAEEALQRERAKYLEEFGKVGPHKMPDQGGKTMAMTAASDCFYCDALWEIDAERKLHRHPDGTAFVYPCSDGKLPDYSRIVSQDTETLLSIARKNVDDWAKVAGEREQLLAAERTKTKRLRELMLNVLDMDGDWEDREHAMRAVLAETGDQA